MYEDRCEGEEEEMSHTCSRITDVRGSRNMVIYHEVVVWEILTFIKPQSNDVSILSPTLPRPFDNHSIEKLLFLLHTRACHMNARSLAREE